MAKSALVIGGTGPTGPHIVNGLLERGHTVCVFHRGSHETSFAGDVEHLHADPHFRESAQQALAGRRFDVAIVTYGRTRILAESLAGRCDQLIGIGATNVYRGGSHPESSWPPGTRLNTPEEGPLVDVPATSGVAAEIFSSKILATERAVFDLARRGAFSATYFRYPIIYGPRNIIPWEWSVVKRVADGRKTMIVCDDGAMIRTRMSSRNAAHAVLLAVDNPDRAAGQSYNCADDQQYSLRQWLELLIDAAGGGLRLVSLPFSIGKPGWSLMPFHSLGATHMLTDISKIRSELGYRDVISTPDALAESVDWYRRNPVTGTSHTDVLDAFDYELEDSLVKAYQEALDSITCRFDLRRPEIHHHYAHPSVPDAGRDHLGR
jgi:nucleoside-diphosphate-sugar epimerase